MAPDPRTRPAGLPAAAMAHAATVERGLADFLDRTLPQLEALHPALAPMAAELEAFVEQGGKRLRPVLLLLGHELAGGQASDVVGAAVAVELLHTCALLHDDVIDAATTRRGRATTHVRFANTHTRAGQPGSSARYGEAIAILLGDLAFVYADAAFLECHVPPKRLLAGLATFAQLREEVMAGQTLDIHAAATRSVDPALALQVATLKSGRYSVTRPLQLGAVLAGADPALLAGLEAFGEPLGRAFQLRDDLLGVFGTETTTGKSVIGDLAEGKRTLLVAEAWARLDEDGRAEMTDRLGADDLTAAQAEQLRTRFERCGARRAVEGRIDEAVGAAQSALPALPASAGRATLAAMVPWFAERPA